MRVQLLATVTALALTTTATSAYTRHHHKHHAHVPNVAQAQADPRVTKSMETLRAMTAKLGRPKLDGQEPVGGKEAPALYFGKTKINNNFDIVDAVGERDGKGMTATLFAKGGDEYIRVSTSVPKPDGRWQSGRYCCGRTGARVHQSRQIVLRRGTNSGNALHNRLRTDHG